MIPNDYCLIQWTRSYSVSFQNNNTFYIKRHRDSLGRFIEALDYFEKFLEIKRALLGTDDHLFIAIGLTNMASVYFSLGKL